ncbi:HAD family hydrolase [Saccharospirillum sp. HFRX-1]|uniref:HAD family hydrolase n=1 Tax=unclassified Saccharospirillum TaxID=2633430 RepID=UPI003712D65A
MIKAVFFDLDNTLVDRNSSIDRFAERFVVNFIDQLKATDAAKIASLIKEHDGGGYLSPDSGFNSLADAISTALFEKLLWRLPPSVGDIETYWRYEFPLCSVEMPGAFSLLTQLYSHGYYLAVISNGSDKSRHRTLESTRLNTLIERVTSSQAAGVSKPSVAIFHKAIAHAGYLPEQCCYIGDHPINDIKGANNAGMQSIWLRGFHGGQKLPEDTLTVDRLDEVLGIIDRLEGNN